MEREKNTLLQKACHWMAAVIISLFVLPPVHAQRQTQTINDSWKFLKGECTAAADSAFRRQQMDIHPSAPYLEYRCLYRKGLLPRHRVGIAGQLTLPQGWKEKQIILRLDAASKAATIYINGKNVGEHAGGYTACSFNITPFLSFDTPNTLAICVDNARQDIAPISGDFTFFGGIYRDVWLTAVPNQHFNLTNHGSDGLFISTPQVSEERGITFHPR